LHEGLKAQLTLTRVADADADHRDVLRIYKTDLATSDGDNYKPVFLVSLTREVRSDGFHLYAIPSIRDAPESDVAELRGILGAGTGLTRLARHDRAGEVQDLIVASP
jgi:hypothetical protein